MSPLKIITTTDGSHSVLNEELNETYHSVHGAIQESSHVFIHHGLECFLARKEQNSISILEVGFGTGLNALLTIDKVRDTNVVIGYMAIEAFPVEKEVWGALNYTHSIGLKEHFTSLHQLPWNEEYRITPQFSLFKAATTLQQVELNENSYDVVYFDAFAPGKQPELWTIEMLRKIVDAMKSKSIFVTYCAKGQLKRDLRNLGLTVESLPGPPGKREMIRATKP